MLKKENNEEGKKKVFLFLALHFFVVMQTVKKHKLFNLMDDTKNYT